VVDLLTWLIKCQGTTVDVKMAVPAGLEAVQQGVAAFDREAPAG
jgi:hypothetical protein